MLDIFFVLELDTYGHYLQRAATHISKQSLEPNFEQVCYTLQTISNNLLTNYLFC